MTAKNMALDTVKDFMDQSYTLIWVDYRDNLDNYYEEIQNCIREKCGDQLYEKLNDHFFDTEYNSIVFMI